MRLPAVDNAATLIAALLASKLLPYPTQVKLGLEAMRDGFIKVYGAAGQHRRPCAGRQAKRPM
jgi:hypothetical protein